MKTATRLFGALFALSAAVSIASASQYPPTGDPNPADTLVYINRIMNAALVPPGYALHDTIWGLGGIIVAKDSIPTGFAIYIQNNSADGGGWHGIDVFTEGNNQGASIGVDGGHPAGLYVGDSVMTYGSTDSFQGSTELRSLGRSFTNPNGPAIRLISRGNQVPAYHNATVHDLYELPTNVSAAQWVLNLVNITANMRVARVGDNVIGTTRNCLLVDNAPCPPGTVSPCESLFVETSTLAGVEPPPLGAAISYARGLYDVRTRGFRIMIRDPTDLGDLQPPNMVDAYSISNDSIAVIFDRAVTSGSALNSSNYSLSSFTSTITPVHMVGTKQVVCFINNGEVPGQAESVTENNVVGAVNGVQQTTPDTRNFTYGILTIAQIRTPSPDSLNLAPCKDVSQFLGADGGLTSRLSYTGVCTAAGLGSLYYIEDAGASTFRTGCAVFAPSLALIKGHKYFIASTVTDFFKEYELQGTVAVKDLGVAAIPAPVVKPIATLIDTTCDVNQNIENGVDWCGDLVQIQNVKIVENRTPKSVFKVAGPYPVCPDSMLVGNSAGAAKLSNVFTPSLGTIVTVTGILHLQFGAYRIEPRDSTDITFVSNDAVGGYTPARVTFSVSPNPGRAQRLSFGLPRSANIDLAVFDVSGRRLRSLARGTFDAGTYKNITWDGTDASGSNVGAGVFFYRLRVDGETYKLNAVRLK